MRLWAGGVYWESVPEGRRIGGAGMAAWMVDVAGGFAVPVRWAGTKATPHHCDLHAPGAPREGEAPAEPKG